MNTTIEQQDGVTIVRAAGRLDFNNAKSFQRVMESLLNPSEESPTPVAVDCAELEYISSAGLRVFLICAQLANRHHVGFTVYHLSPLVKDVFGISGFDTIMPICTDKESALATLKGIDKGL